MNREAWNILPRFVQRFGKPAKKPGLKSEDQLIHTAHWTTPPKLPRRFCTWFFLCPLHEEVEVNVDNDEILDFRWLGPDAAIEAAENDSMVLPRPTLTTLRDLSGHATLPSLLSGWRGRDSGLSGKFFILSPGRNGLLLKLNRPLPLSVLFSKPAVCNSAW